MTERFLNMVPFLFEWEGVKYENDPDDPGGETKFGLDKRSHPNEDIRKLTAARAKQIYFDEYWKAGGRCGLPEGCDSYAHPLGEVVFNCVVNCGPARARQFLRAGARTAEKFIQEQEAFYRRLVVARPKSEKYLKGWLNRLVALKKHLDI